MTTSQVIDRYNKNLKVSKEFAETELSKNIINYAKDKIHSIIMLSGLKHCDAGHLINQFKRIFK